MTGQFSSMISNRRGGGIVCLALGLSLLAGCATETKSVYDEAPSVSELSFNADSILRVADRLRDTGDYVAALHMYQQVRERDPKNTQALIGEGEILLGLGAFPEAEQRFRTARAFGDESARSAAGLGRALLRQNRPGDALAFFESALQQQDATAQIYNGYGVTLDLLGRHDDAQIAYSEGLDRAAGDVILTNNLALSFALSQDYAAALRILSDLAAARPDSEGARQNLALVYGMSGDMAAARSVAALDLEGEALDKRLGYIARIAALPVAVQGEAIILGVEPDEAVAKAETEVEPQPEPEPHLQTRQETKPEPQPVPQAEPEKAEAVMPSAGAGEVDAADEEPALTEEPVLADEPAYLVQLGAYLGDTHARAGWNKLVKRAPDVLGTYDPVFQTLEVEGENGEPETMVRVGVKVTEGYVAADALCGSFRAAGVDCLVRRIKESADGGSGTP